MVVPKIWKRLMANVVDVVFLVLLISLVLGSLETTSRSALFIVLLVLYITGVVYMGIVWQLASVISVLEDLKGIKAMIKSKALIKGKVMVACAIFINLSIMFSLIEFVFETMVVHGEKLGMGMWIRVLCGIVCFLLVMQLFLFGLVVQPVFYVVCKSYHHEIINKSLLADHLQVLCGRVCPYQRQQDNQLEQYDV
ncbi:uncharacterized protein LOC122074384 [Macadamia integrifolia]|uniref:uncharacterized protein LOC122074384 n=1 Tax=Macadamia integrifolia TaxID=60698 RepID=UPI001C4E466C|nr:uncharacterized protein LOC122074384 [Macadamia integrifolia]